MSASDTQLATDNCFMKKPIASLRCPTCRKIVLASDAEFPFCSERCRVIDLANWADGKYVISSPAAPATDDDED